MTNLKDRKPIIEHSALYGWCRAMKVLILTVARLYELNYWMTMSLDVVIVWKPGDLDVTSPKEE